MRPSPRVLAVVASLWTMSGHAASAQTAPSLGQADEAQFHFQRGNRAYQERRFEDALASYYLSNQLVANRNVEFNIARCLDKLRRYDEAYRAWSALLDQDLPEKEHAAVQQAIDQLRPHVALVRIDSQPPGATVYVGRRDLGAMGTTPKSLALPPGGSRIILEHEGYAPVEIQAEPGLGKEIALSAKLERIFATIDIRRIPPEAEIRRDFIDGELVRRGPGTLRLLPGPVVLFVSAPGWETERITVNALPGAMTPVDVLLQPMATPTGALVVRCNIPGALVRIDGKEAGFAPTVVADVPAGQRKVEVAAEGRDAHVQTVDVSKDARTFVDAYLRHADPEVSAATKSSITSENAPASVSVVSADEIAGFGYQSLTQALAAIRSTFTSNDRSYESVGLHGFSPPGDYTNRVLVLVDGHPINDAVTGQGYVGHDLDVDLSNVARIEVVRGPGSVLYGTGALFGVINVVTKEAVPGKHATVHALAGTMGLLSGRATAGVRRDGSSLMLSAAAMRSDGDRRFDWPAQFDEAASPAPRETAPILDADRERASHLDLVGRLGSFGLRAAFNERRKELPTGAYGSAPGSDAFNHDRRAFAELRFDRALAAYHVAARAAYDVSWYHGHFPGPSDGEGAEQRLRAQWVTAEARVELPRVARQKLTVGSELVAQLDLSVRERTSASVPRDLIVSAYVVDDVLLSSRLTLNVGLRGDSYTRTFGGTLNPRLALIGRPYPRGNTKLFLGRSFRVPSPYERADPSAESRLRPETSWSGEIEHTHALSDDVRIVGAVFASWIDHLIQMRREQPELVPPSYETGYASSPDRVRSVGAAVEVRWEPGGGVLVTVSATRQQVVQLGPDGPTPFANAPERMLKARVLCPLQGTALRLGSELVVDSGRHVDWRTKEHVPGDDTVDDAFLWNLSLSGDYRPYRVSYFAGVMNLLDVHGARSGFPTAADNRLILVPRYGRTVRVGLRWTF